MVDLSEEGGIESLIKKTFGNIWRKVGSYGI